MMVWDIVMNRNAFYILGFLLTLTLLIAGTNHIATESTNNLDEKIDELEKDQEKLKDKKGTITEDKQSTEGKMEKNEDKQQTVADEVNDINEELVDTETSIEDKEKIGRASCRERV